MRIKCLCFGILAIVCSQIFFALVCAANTGNSLVKEEINLESVKSQACKNYLRALELSLYYQGFDANKTFNKLDGFFEGSNHSNQNEIPYNSELVGQRKLRDASLALKWGEKAAESMKMNSYVNGNLFKLYVSELEVGDNKEKLFDLINKPSIFEKLQKDDFNGAPVVLSSLFAYIYYKGIGVPQDLKKCDKILKMGDPMLSWKNFYIGKFAPCDREFAIYMLKQSSNKMISANSLCVIYSGRLNSADANADEANHWDMIFKTELELFKAKNLELKIKKMRDAKSAKGVSLELIQKDIMLAWLFDEVVTMPNPFYNPSLAEKFFSDKDGKISYEDLRILIVAHIKENGDTEYSRKYYEMAKALAKSPSELEELENFRLGLLKHSKINDTQIPFWIDAH